MGWCIAILLMTSIYYGTLTPTPSDEPTMNFNENEGSNYESSDMESEEVKAGKTFIKGKNREKKQSEPISKTNKPSGKPRKPPGKPRKPPGKPRKPPGKPRKPSGRPRNPQGKPIKPTGKPNPTCLKRKKQRGGRQMPKKRILGGNEYYPQFWNSEDTPRWERWIASVLTMTYDILPNGDFDIRTCSGVLISKQHILTALHCVSDWNNTGYPFPSDNVFIFFDVQDARSGLGHEFRAKKIMFLDDQHGKVQYFKNSKIIKEDLAVIQLDKPILPQHCLHPIKIIDNRQLKRDSSGKIVLPDYWIAGWGIFNFVPGFDSYPDNLQYISKLPNIPCPQDERIDIEKTLCFEQTNQKAACLGDSGSPGVIKVKDEWYLQGIRSRGLAAPGYTFSSCNEPKSIGLDINVFKYKNQIQDWIKPDKLE